MDKLRIRGGTRLQGQTSISGSKNSTLPILAATLLTSDAVHIHKVPHLRDVTTMNTLLATLGARISVQDNMVLEICAKSITDLKAPYELVKTMRASFLVLGPLLARFGQVEVSLPGGCAIGARPIDQHLKGVEAMGASVELEDGYVKAVCSRGLTGSRIVMDVVTVTGTQNIMMAATLARGSTRIDNAAREPEVVELAACLQKMGARIYGAGTSSIEVEGVDELHGCSYEVMSDRIEAGTFLIAAAATRGCVKLLRCPVEALSAVLVKLREAGADIRVEDQAITLDSHGERPRAIDLRTAVYPGLPTDLQAQFLTLNAVAKGTGRVTETIFENRFMHVPELIRLGANIDMESSTTAVSRGVETLHGAPVMATDLRASSSLIIAGLAAQGETTVDRIYHIDRGYERIEEKLRALGGDVERVNGR